jgi:hypothetical protein
MPLSVAEAFRQFKSNLKLGDSFQDAVTTHHGAVREWVESYAPGIETQLIGSLQRRTRIPPRPKQDTFDIDILVVLGNFHSWVSYGGVTPASALDKVEEIVSDHETYDRMDPEADSPTISFEYADGIKVELVPAYLDQIGYDPAEKPTYPTGRGFWIPKRGKWELADYNYDAAYITQANEAADKYLVPTIKMLKAAKRRLFAKITSYHLEAMAAAVLPGVVETIKVRGIVNSCG